MRDLAYLGVVDAAALFRQGELSPVDLAESLLARIAEVDPVLHAFLHVDPDAVLGQAARAEAEMRGGVWRGPLHGIPYALKDNIDVAGVATTCHSKIRVGVVAERDAAVVRRLGEAGAVLVGKASLHEFATGGPSFDLPWPPARNPWDAARHPGGSSSGCASAVAAGLAAFAIGTDTGGSVRNPATACGLIGLKPSYDEVSRDGVFPLAPSLDHVGPLTRSIDDNAAVMRVIAEERGGGDWSRGAPAAGHEASGLAGVRIGVIEHFYTEDDRADPEIVAALERAVEVMQNLGAHVEPVRLPPLDVWNDCGRTIQRFEQYRIHEAWLRERPGDYGELGRERLRAGAAVTAEDYAAAVALRRELRAAFDSVMSRFDALVTLSSFDLPCEIDDPAENRRTYVRHARMPFNVTGTPALAVPTGFSASGMPMGMQLAGRAFDERTLYRVGGRYLEQLDGRDRRPALPADG